MRFMIHLQSKQEVSPELEADAEKGLDKRSPSLVISSDDEDDDEVPVNHIVNRRTQNHLTSWSSKS